MDNFFQTYLPQVVSKIQNDPDFMNNVTIIIGNESCDLDSAVCAIVFAHALASSDKNRFYVPMLNIPREDVDLRTEVLYCVGRQNLASVPCRDDIDLGSNFKLILVDHHVLSAKDVHLADNVVKIVDHRTTSDDKSVLNSTDDVTIELVGSCATLVADICMRDLKYQDVDGLKLLWSTILTDTINLSSNAKKVTRRDIKVVELIEEMLPSPFVGMESRSQTFQKIFTEKSNLSNLTAYQILKKDLKIFDAKMASSGEEIRIAIPSILLSTPELSKKDVGADFAATLRQICDTCHADICLTMGLEMSANKGDVISRDLFVYAPKFDEKFGVVVDFADNFARFKKTDNLADIGRHYDVVDLSLSRKRVVPMLMAAIEK